jgi:aminopeptidase N
MDIALPQPVYLSDYRPPDYRIERIELDIDLDETETRVKARLHVARRGEPVPLVLDGEDLELHAVAIDGRRLAAGEYTADERGLTLPPIDRRATVDIETGCRPAENTRLEGLFVSRGTFCTQCEAEGFRRITFFIDRPDTMAVYTTTLRGVRARAPVLLSNGNLVETRDLGSGRHLATWHDPHPKPCYLFALVAGDLACVEDRFVTASGREVTLRIWVELGHEARCAYALASLKRAMRWDEQTYGLEYDLDLFNIVAVADFNMGAMENKSLNIFNAKYILADPETATDSDYELIESVVAHEYFHNWTGNRVTCRDWFQLSLKEGLTVFRDQQFSAAMRSAAVKRIEAVRLLRARQFPEDAGPLAHPVRPASYIEINNFYTPTVYEKGAEVIRMMHTLLGAEGFRKGIDLYFARHDGEAATCDDFVAAMEDANGADLGQFRLWYAQAGTPELEVSGRYLHAEKAYELTVAQSVAPTPGEESKRPLHIPLAIGLLDRGGREIPLRLEGEPASAAKTTRILELKQARHTFRFVDVAAPPVPSLNRGFSAPARLHVHTAPEDRALLMAHDADLFNRWEAGQQFAAKLLLDMVAAIREGREAEADAGFVDALARLLRDQGLDKALLAEAMALPGEDYLATRMETVDVEAIHAARETLRRAIAERLSAELLAVYRANRGEGPTRADAESAARRALKNRVLSYLAVAPEGELRALVSAQYLGADNMTDRIAPLALLVDRGVPERDDALADFYLRFEGDELAIDKWFALQARSALPDTLARVADLLAHPAFSLKSPNKVRALIAGFASGNQLRFHAADGAGYRFLAERVLELDALNPHSAARLLTPLGRWRRFDAGRQALMRGELQRILAAPKLSPDVYEIASKSLG